ncbi:hypothetical protein [Streptomyces sp. NPDC059649]|uniref:hypothetical protein n=1 Tax=Streptomyces sp. NPDC059649 TaxID=3346895 RepID=UPI00369C257C
MARLDVEGDALVVRPAWWEKIAVRRAAVTVPLQAVTGVSVQEDWWRALRGSPVRGRSFSVPEYRCLGVWQHRDGQDFVAIAPRRGPVVQVDLHSPSDPRSPARPGPSPHPGPSPQQPAAAAFARIAVTTPQAQDVVAAIRAALRRRAEARPGRHPPDDASRVII